MVDETDIVVENNDTFKEGVGGCPPVVENNDTFKEGVGGINPPENNDVDKKKQLAQERSRVWRQKNRQKNTDYHRGYYHRNIEQLRQYGTTYMKNYYDTHPEKRLKHNARVLASKQSLTAEQKELNKLERKVKKYEKNIQITESKYEEAKHNLNSFKNEVDGVDTLKKSISKEGVGGINPPVDV